MNNYSEDVKKEFERQFENMAKNEHKEKKTKVALLYACFMVVFLFVLTGTILSYNNYVKVKNNLDNKVNVIQKVTVKEY